jgi:hypothetical protein
MAEMHLPHADRETTEPASVDHETSDVNIRAIFGFAIGLTVTTIVVGFAVWLLFQYFNAREAQTTFTEYPLAAQESRVPPEPRLQTNPREDMGNLRAREDQALTSYGWVDKNAGIVRIPIERAMQLIVERGLPARPANERR